MEQLKKIMTTKNSGLIRSLLLLIVATFPVVLVPFFIASSSLEATTETRSQTLTMALPREMHNQTAPASANAPTPYLQATPQIGYDASVIFAVKEMGLTVDHFDAWLDVHPSSALKHIKYMPEYMQKDVASIALFIRKSNPRIDAKTSWREAAALVHYSSKYGVPTALTTAVAHVESTFDPNAVSPKGASGVMQVMWRIHNGLLQANGIKASGGSNPMSDPELSIAAGCLLLSRYIRAYGSVQIAMERYYGKKSVSYQRKIDRKIASLLSHHEQLYK